MGMLSTLLAFPVMGPVKGLLFIAEKLQEQALMEQLDENRIQQQLMELELRRDLGEIDDQEFAAREVELLEQLDAIREYREQQEKEQGPDHEVR